MVVLAQLVEHRIVVPSVVGSSPTFHPKKKEIVLVIVSFLFAYLGIVIATPFPCGFPDLTLRISFKQTATNVFVNILNAYRAAILYNSQNYCIFACR